MENKPTFGQFCWNELATPNTQAAKDFYSKVFGWEFTDKTVGDMTYTMIKINGQEQAGMWAIPKDQQKDIPPHWMSYVLVENLEASLEKATQAGATVIKPATTAGDFGRFAIIRDPIGAHIAMWQPIKK